MTFPQKLILLLFGITAVFVSFVVTLDQACYGHAGARLCSQHHLQCQKGNIFILWAFRGFKNPLVDTCTIQSTNCNKKDSCCRYDEISDCLEYYTDEAFSSLMEECQNKTNCTYRVQEANQATYRCLLYRDKSGYSMVEYACLQGSPILDFRDSTPKTGESIVLRYVKSDDTNSYVCRVEAEDCTNRSVEVALFTRPTRKLLPPCTNLIINDRPGICSVFSIQYVAYMTSTPSTVRLHVVKTNDVDEALALFHAGSSKLRVTCKPQTHDEVTFQKCIPVTALSTTSEVTPSHFASLSMAVPDMSTVDDIQTSSISSTDSASSPGVTKDTMHQFAENAGSTAVVVGGVVGAVLLVLVALVTAVVCYKRRSSRGKPFFNVTWFKGGDSSRFHGNSARGQPTSLPAYDNSAATIADEAGIRDADGDYNHLGQKPSSSASRDVTYGHLADGSDVTDYGYDHVTKGKPAVRSGDVINNVYDTAGPPTAGPYDEDFYNTSGGTKNRPDIINNVYNAPGSATDAGCDVDYYNVTGVPHASRDVTNNDYSTPKPGSHVVSPYELARKVN